MPLYHFHLVMTDGEIGDVEGREIDDDRAALQEAGIALGEALRDELSMGKLNSRPIVKIERHDGTLAATIKVHLEVIVES